MRTKKTIFISVITALALIVGATAAMAGSNALISDLGLTKEQIGKLGKIVEGFSAEKLELEAKIDNKVAHILKTKDVLTLEQKMALFHMMLMVAQ